VVTNDGAAGGLQWMVASSHAAPAPAAAELMLCAALISIQAMTSRRQRPARDLDHGAVGWLADCSVVCCEPRTRPAIDEN